MARASGGWHNTFKLTSHVAPPTGPDQINLIQSANILQPLLLEGIMSSFTMNPTNTATSFDDTMLCFATRPRVGTSWPKPARKGEQQAETAARQAS